jgi:hypothetical protein
VNARSCPSCHSIGAPRLIITEGSQFTCVDAWHASQPRHGVPSTLEGARIDPASLPPGSDPDRSRETLGEALDRIGTPVTELHRLPAWYRQRIEGRVDAALAEADGGHPPESGQPGDAIRADEPGWLERLTER